MNPKVNTTLIDAEACIGCGECVHVCPSKVIEMKEDKAVVTGENSIGCGHCVAVCPVSAVRISFVEDDALILRSVKGKISYLKPGEFDTAALVSLMTSRRSCRNFDNRPVEREVLEDLIRIGITAPSGTNSQAWTFTILGNRSAVLHLGEEVAAFFTHLNHMAKNPALRLLSKLFLKDALGQYYRDYYESVQRGLREWKEEKTDRLFHGAPAAILVGSTPNASCPTEDALLVSQNILLSAHAMGLGSCLVGFVVEALRHDPSIKKKLLIPKEEKIHAVIALGTSKENYHQPAGRKKITPRWVEK